MREEVQENGVAIAEAERRVVDQAVFTTHTPVEAGHDRFDPSLVEQTLKPLREKIGLSEDAFCAYGRIGGAEHKAFGMTTLALRLSRRANAVSALHGRTARRMWRKLWPDRNETEVPISHITNGVHLASWVAPPLVRFYNESLGPDWESEQCSPTTWSAMARVDNEQFWEVHQILKARLLESVFRWMHRQEERRNGNARELDALEKHFHPGVLTIAFARRFATYKRADLIFSDEQRLADLLNDDNGSPVQLIFAGKAHPRDEDGQALIQRIFRLAASERFRGHLLFIEDYDINIARHLVQGCDVWLNTPLRTREACGTSGMKAMFNGALNLSIQDGWWAEAYNGLNGFSIGNGEAHADPERQRERDAASLYETLENEVIPLYYKRNEQGIPSEWVDRMKNALTTLAWRFNADRMVMEYARECYLPAAGIKASAPVQKRKPCI
jgi:starch phosphorylase